MTEINFNLQIYKVINPLKLLHIINSYAPYIATHFHRSCRGYTKDKRTLRRFSRLLSKLYTFAHVKNEQIFKSSAVPTNARAAG